MNPNAQGDRARPYRLAVVRPCQEASRTLREGFTMVELLVVIAIIAILASLLMAALSKAKSKTHSIQCKNNLRAIVLGFSLSVDEDDGRLWTTQGVGPSFGTAQARWWAETWGIPQRGSICPAAPERLGKDRVISNFDNSTGDFLFGTTGAAWVLERPVGPPWWGSARPGSFRRRVGSYAPNNWAAGTWWDWTEIENPLPFSKESQIVDSHRTPLFGDGNFWWYLGGTIIGPRARNLPPANLKTGGGRKAYEMASFALPRHGSPASNLSTNHPPSETLPGAINVAFQDGHVEQVPLDHLWQLYWHRGYQPPLKRPGL